MKSASFPIAIVSSPAPFTSSALSTQFSFFEAQSLFVNSVASEESSSAFISAQGSVATRGSLANEGTRFTKAFAPRHSLSSSCEAKKNVGLTTSSLAPMS